MCQISITAHYLDSNFKISWKAAYDCGHRVVKGYHAISLGSGLKQLILYRVLANT